MKFPKIAQKEQCVSIEVPFKENKDFRVCACPPKDYLRTYRAYLMDALKARIEHCYNGLMENLTNIITNNGYTIAWKNKEGKQDYFNIPSYNTMLQAYKALEDKKEEILLKSLPMCDQLIKALMFSEDFEGKRTIISLLMEIIICFNQHPEIS